MNLFTIIVANPAIKPDTAEKCMNVDQCFNKCFHNFLVYETKFRKCPEPVKKNNQPSGRNLLAERNENKFKPYLQKVHTGNKNADATRTN